MNIRIASMIAWTASQRCVRSVTLVGLVGAMAVIARGAAPTANTAEGIASLDFARDVRPILAEHCWSCHGQDEKTREAKLRLDVREEAVAPRKRGRQAIVPGDAGRSMLVARVETEDESELMPPPEAKKPLSAAQKQALRHWVEQGAPYAQHWAFIPPRRPELPAVRDADWSRNAVDRFIMNRLEREGMHPSPPASRATLLRRVSLDLTGLPPTPVELDTFLADAAPDAYEKAVDRLLASPAYGERMAMNWLDAARYADTNGYNNDEGRNQWPWRDWVIHAFASNLPYDQFVTQQLAGDLLPAATLEQKVATGFNRNHVLTTEGGVVDEEYRVEYVVDRVHTTATVFLGLTMQCARCHDHKFDPISQKEFYQFFAFFNNQPDKPGQFNAEAASAAPFVRVPTAAQSTELARLDARKIELEKLLATRAATADERVAGWERSLGDDAKRSTAPLGLVLHLPLDEANGGKVHDAVNPSREWPLMGTPTWSAGKVGGALGFDGNTYADLGQAVAFDSSDKYSVAGWVYPAATDAIAVLSKMDDAGAYRGLDVLLEGGRVASHLVSHWPDDAIKVLTKSPIPVNAWSHLVVTYDGSRKAAGVHIYVNGQPQPTEVVKDSLTGSIITDKPVHLGRRASSLAFQGKLDDVRIYSAELSAADAARLAGGRAGNELVEVFATPAEKRTAEQKARLRLYYLETADADYKREKAELTTLPKLRADAEKAMTAAMVMEELPQTRPAYILGRGQYDQKGQAVTPGVPAFLPPLPAGAPANRLGLAKWLADPSHPLTARVAVNRWWAMYFGTGLVETEEDFGVRGALPSHPELLDWLATELIRTGWDVKAMQRLIVTSSTYRQSSAIAPEQAERDPKNRLLARGPRFRMPAETVRDNALAVSGLLREHVGGPSVRPYQPAGLWEEVSVSHSAKYVPDKGEGLYRRSMYTYWKRTCPPPALIAFDAPDRETCLIRRARTNTPIQALVLLNDPTYIEAARKLAERALLAAKPEPEARVAYAFRLAVAREPADDERRVLILVYREALGRYQHDKSAAEKLLAVGDSPRDAKLEPVELAAWTAVANVILNLDETISKD